MCFVLTGCMSKPTRRNQQILRVARERCGFENLRPGQEGAVRSVLDGRDTLAVMPTGAGKSAIYQIAACLLPGATVVVSPLIALQRDQLQSIQEQDIGEAAVVNSTVSSAEKEEVIDAVAEGEVEFLFVAPEQFANEEIMERLRQARPSLFVVDEAHCITEWGHDFRPDYMRLGAVVEMLGHPTVLAMTATATPRVREEIVTRLNMREPNVIVSGFDRPNIWLGVESYQDEGAKQVALVNRVVAAEKPGIVYAATRGHAEEIAALLAERGLRAEPYHAGLRPRDREQTQERFMSDELDVIVATIAFGMGVDKPNVRFVFHYDISDSIDSYYQEIGRAGRDGEPARAILFYRPEDTRLRRFFAGGKKLTEEQVSQVIEAIGEGEGPIDPKELLERVDISSTRLTTVLNRLEDVGALETAPTGEILPAGTDDPGEEVVARALRVQETRRELDLARVEMIESYAQSITCRRRQLLHYFGEEDVEPCGTCDNCEAGRGAPSVEEEPFPVNSRVHRNGWGEGIVLGYEDGKIILIFETVGRKTLDVGVVMKRSLLKRAEGGE